MLQKTENISQDQFLKDALGHSKYSVTEGYLKSLSDDKINTAFNKLYE